MKKLLLTAFFILCAVCTEAQVSLNARAGAGISNFSDGPSGAWKACIGIDIPISNKFVFTPSIEYAQKGVTQVIDIGDERRNISRTRNLMSVQVPLQFGYIIRTGRECALNLKFGPYFGIPITGGNYSTSISEFDNKFDCGIDTGVDFRYKHFIAGIDFQAGLKKQEDFGDGYKLTALYLTLGYQFSIFY